MAESKSSPLDQLLIDDKIAELSEKIEKQDEIISDLIKRLDVQHDSLKVLARKILELKDKQ